MENNKENSKTVIPVVREDGNNHGLKPYYWHYDLLTIDAILMSIDSGEMYWNYTDVQIDWLRRRLAYLKMKELINGNPS